MRRSIRTVSRHCPFSGPVAHAGNAVPAADDDEAVGEVELEACFVFGEDAGLDRPDPIASVDAARARSSAAPDSVAAGFRVRRRRSVRPRRSKRDGLTRRRRPPSQGSCPRGLGDEPVAREPGSGEPFPVRRLGLEGGVAGGDSLLVDAPDGRPVRPRAWSGSSPPDGAVTGCPGVRPSAPARRGPGSSRPTCRAFRGAAGPASTRIFRWWDTVGWPRSSGSVRSQTQASPPRRALDDGEQPEPVRVGQGLEHRRPVLRFLRAQGRRCRRRAAGAVRGRFEQRQ